MDKINGNYLTQQNKDFPLDCEALDYIAKNAAIVETLGNIGGDKVVLSGCELTSGGTVRTEGYVFLRTKDFPNGEVLKWEGGQVGTMCLKKEDIGVTADGYKYPKAYTRRYLAAGMGEENYNWADFSDLKTNIELARQVKELEEQIARVAGEPLGIVKMWAGRKIPAGYLLCDGKEYLATDPEYSKLYEAIGDTFNGAKNANGAAYTTQSGYFRVPDLQGRFIVGYNSSDSEYNQSGLSGGEKTHLLTPGENPRENAIFITLLLAAIRAIEMHADILRMATAGAGNDHRLGAAEAPPAVVSMFLGDELNAVVDALAMFLLPDDSPMRCRHYYCSIVGDEESTEVFIVPRNEFGVWLAQEKNIRKTVCENPLEKAEKES